MDASEAPDGERPALAQLDQANGEAAGGGVAEQFQAAGVGEVAAGVQPAGEVQAVGCVVVGRTAASAELGEQVGEAGAEGCDGRGPGAFDAAGAFFEERAGGEGELVGFEIRRQRLGAGQGGDEVRLLLGQALAVIP